LGAKGAVSIVGYVFDEGWAARNRSAVDRFLQVTHEAKKILAGSAAEWQRLASRIGTTDTATLAIYRQRYLEGIPQRTSAEEAEDAKALYLVLAETGGADLVGSAKALDPKTFYRPGRGD
jgi:NitT/TauT family transport system substrate-binding protein